MYSQNDPFAVKAQDGKNCVQENKVLNYLIFFLRFIRGSTKILRGFTAYTVILCSVPLLCLLLPVPLTAQYCEVHKLLHLD
jgi:hypothetical protein